MSQLPQTVGADKEIHRQVVQPVGYHNPTHLLQSDLITFVQ
jgi:hypothetical protein